MLPWMRGGWLLALDWIGGPGVSLPRTFWGLDGAVNGSLGFTLLATGLMRAIGPAAGWVVIAAFLLVAFFSAAWLVQGPPARRLAAGTFFVVNPFVYDRLVSGQVAFVAGYSLLPLVFGLLLELVRRWQVGRIALAALTMSVAVSFAPHFGWIFVLVALALLSHAPRRALRLTVTFGMVAAASCYLLPGFRQGSAVGLASTERSIFQTIGAPIGGPYGSLLLLHGFWRGQPAPTVPGWPFFFAAIVLLLVLGAVRMRKHDSTLFWSLLPAALMALVLAAGDQGPARGMFSWFIDVVPGSALMREPQKFLALTVLAYAVAFGFGVERVAVLATGNVSRSALAVALALPLLYSPSLFWGLGGQVRPAQYPDDWAQAAHLMGDGDGQLLFLPWHQYLSFPFTSGVIANPADVYFDRRVISGDNVELARAPTLSTSPRSRYLQLLFRHGPRLCSAGGLFAPLGVEFVALAKTVDWDNYEWLHAQRDLQLLHDGPSIRLYRNLAFTGTVWRSATIEEVRDVGELIDRSRTAPVAGRVFRARAPEGVPSDAAPPCGEPVPGVLAAGKRLSPVRYIANQQSGAPWAVLAEPFETGWGPPGETVELATGTTGVRTRNQTSIVFRPWTWVKLTYASSAITTLAMIAVMVAGPIRRRSSSNRTARSVPGRARRF